MPNAKIERWVAAIGFFVLAVMLCVEGVAIFGTYAAGPGYRQSSTAMMTMQFRPGQ
jgi:hypothetical protein